MPGRAAQAARSKEVLIDVEGSPAPARPHRARQCTARGTARLGVLAPPKAASHARARPLTCSISPRLALRRPAPLPEPAALSCCSKHASRARPGGSRPCASTPCALAPRRKQREHRSQLVDHPCRAPPALSHHRSPSTRFQRRKAYETAPTPSTAALHRLGARPPLDIRSAGSAPAGRGTTAQLELAPWPARPEARSHRPPAPRLSASKARAARSCAHARQLTDLLAPFSAVPISPDGVAPCRPDAGAIVSV